MEKVTRMSGPEKEKLLAKITRDHKNLAKWSRILKSGDVNQIWSELQRIVASHPLVRASKRAGFLVEEGKYNAYTDLTQELFVTLLSKDRFKHYIESKMVNAAIEAQISQIELTNMLTAELRKRYPESYRLARRISDLVQTSELFKRFDNIGNPDAHRRLADRVYGLADWKDAKESRNVGDMEESVTRVSFHKRDTRMVGCTGDAQIVISNIELEKLMVRVLRAIDSPVDVRSLRSFVMSRLPIMDIHLVPVGGASDSDDDHGLQFEFTDMRETPEETCLRHEREAIAESMAEEFLADLKKSVKGKEKQYQRMMQILWLCYLDPSSRTQLVVADMLVVSDSLVSDYRRRIVSKLRLFNESFSSMHEVTNFEKALEQKVYDFLSRQSEHAVAQETQLLAA